MKTLPLRSARMEIFPDLYNFPGHPCKSLWIHLLSTRCTWIRLLSSMPPTQFTWHFREGATCGLFTLGNRCISCYATHATYRRFCKDICILLTLGHMCISCYTIYMACQRDLLVNIQQEYPFVAITQRPTISWSGSTCLGPIYGLNRSV